jgi:hypothetical protein
MPVAAIGALGSLVLVCLAACGGEDDEPVPIEEIPSDSRLSQLGAAELDGACEWASALAMEALPPGTMCNGVPIQSTGCMPVPDSCPATVGQWMQCLPSLLDRFGQEPCVLLDLRSPPTTPPRSSSKPRAAPASARA